MSLVPVSQIMAKIRRGEVDGMNAAVDAVADQSDKNAPKDTEALVHSRQTEVEVTAGHIRGKITYGQGLGDPHAVIVHEKTDIHHSNGGPKYLERAMASELPKVREALASEIRKEIH